MKITKKTIMLSHILTLFCCTYFYSQVADVSKEVTKDTLKPKWYTKISLRQSFQSKNDRAEPAYVTLIFPKDSASSQNFSFALGYNILSPTSDGSINPFIEWQKNNLTSKKQNVFLTGVNLSIPIVKKETNSPNTTDFFLYTIAALNYKHDAIKKTEGTQASLYFSPAFVSPDIVALLPDDSPEENPVIDYWYNLYGGLEYENRSQVENPKYKGKTGRWYFRVTGTFYPAPNYLNRRLEITPDFTYRNAFSNTSEVEERINTLFKFSVNFVFFKKKESKVADVKLGYEYKTGCDPTVGFDKQSINSITLKISI
ncbi:hypothetical protein [uncultured Chryseobacterium sp.]|uniref:hypothetical protein n=1 Tax=uncultured Chryseobacterium sp. TaxID=259322 RepID=UPI0025DE5EA8|nr:hypothetical protein [uncultured Chryseobacterium sp.]